MAQARFEIVKRRDGKSVCRLVAPNGAAVMTGKPEDTRAGAIGASLVIRAVAADAELVDLSHERR